MQHKDPGPREGSGQSPRGLMGMDSGMNDQVQRPKFLGDRIVSVEVSTVLKEEDLQKNSTLPLANT